MKLNKHALIILFFSFIFLSTTGFTVIGHRGNPTKYPEESIQSDNSAFKAGADYVELDLHLSKDGIAVVSHDDDLFRVTHTHAIVSQNYFHTLSQLQYDNGEHIISLEQLFKYYQNKPNTKFLLETKIDHSIDHSYKLEEEVAKDITKYHMQKRVMIHSFSNASLFRLRKLMPHIYLILLVGNLKRINFSTLAQVNAINVSADLIQHHAWLIHWLHNLHKQVLVWAEMDETPSLWHWLINHNIDGAVTNFPATGFKYKLAKMDSKKYQFIHSGRYLGNKKIAVLFNPYVHIRQTDYIYPQQKVKTMYAVKIANQVYYQIARQTFVPAADISLNLTNNDIAIYKNKPIVAKNNYSATLYTAPEKQTKTNKKLPPNTVFKVLNFNGSPKNLWLNTRLGWLQAKDVLFLNFFDQASLYQYHNLAKKDQHPNIALLPYSLPQSTAFTYLQNLQLLNQFMLSKNLSQ